MKVIQFRYGADNFSYLIHNEEVGLAVDPGAVNEILSYVEKSGLRLETVTNTHLHPDHTPGNRDILRESGAVFVENKMLYDLKAIEMGSDAVEIHHTPGHTSDSFTFKAGNCLITGDTLFNGTVGNCFSGDLRAFFLSIQKIFAFPPATVVYAGHDYVKYAVQFARSIEPDNPDLEPFLAQYDPYHVYSTLADEMKINPYVRFNDPKIVALLKKRGLNADTEFERWKSLMEVY